MSSSPTDVLVDVTMPQMGVSVAEGTVVGWRVEPGDRIEADATICEISTDKIDTEVPAPVTGVVTEILVPIGETVDVGTVIARIAAGGGGGGATDGPTTPQQPQQQQEQQPPPPHDAPDSGASVGAGARSTTSGGSHDTVRGATDGAGNGRAPDHRRYSPVVQRIAAEHGIDLSQIEGTGRGGRVRKQDVLAFLESGAVEEPPLHIESPYRPDPVVPAPPPGATTAPAAPPAAAPAAPPAAAPAGPPAPVAAPGRSDATPAGAVTPGTGGELSRMRRQIGQHMKRSLDTAATCTTWIEVDMGRVEAARGRLGVTALAFVARACIEALREHPALNAWLEGERYTEHSDVNLGIAVSLGDDGLIVPVVQKAHELSVEGLAVRIREIARRARARQLTVDDVQGGTFTITNPGQYGSIMATPIINQPQVAILDLEAISKRPVVVTDADGNDSIAIRPMTILGLSWDHRALDGALSAQFLATVKRNLESVS